MTNDNVIRTLRINGGERTFQVPDGETLLGALGRENVFIPSACGGRGKCGKCKLKVTRGGGPLQPAEEKRLSPAERDGQMRLSCQIRIGEDLDIEIPKELFASREFQARVLALETLTYDIKRLRLELIEPKTISFVPGQYVQLITPASDRNPNPVCRSFSIASDPMDHRHLELIIRLVPNGICTSWVFTGLTIGDRVSFRGPDGDFRIHDSDRELIFIAGGSGMAPFVSILHEASRTSCRRPIRFFFGAKAVRDLFYLEEMRQFEKQLPDFRFIPALSEPLPEDRWDGERGLITDVVGRHYPDCRDKEAYLCGSPGMIDACLKVLNERGLAQDHIFFDKY